MSCWLKHSSRPRVLLPRFRRDTRVRLTKVTVPRTSQVAQAGCDPSNTSDSEQEVVTFFTSDGLVQLPKWQPFSKSFKPRQHTPLPTWQEQGLCIGNTFWLTATNGSDICRRLKLMGYCRCTEQLSDVVEHTVLSSGGAIVMREHRSSSGLHDTLYMTVAIPLLWGIPPRHESLSTAIISGGGVVEKVYRQWQLYQ